MNWIRQSKRLAIYLRDGLSCIWCGRTIEDGIRLTLDHVIPRSHHGSNHETNLITSCLPCNAKRKHWSVSVFAFHLSRATGGAVAAADIVEAVRYACRQPIDVVTAEEIIRRRGGLAAFLSDRSGAA